LISRPTCPASSTPLRRALLRKSSIGMSLPATFTVSLSAPAASSAPARTRARSPGMPRFMFPGMRQPCVVKKCCWTSPTMLRTWKATLAMAPCFHAPVPRSTIFSNQKSSDFSKRLVASSTSRWLSTTYCPDFGTRGSFVSWRPNCPPTEPSL
jgi:hypothetical protein